MNLVENTNVFTSIRTDLNIFSRSSMTTDCFIQSSTSKSVQAKCDSSCHVLYQTNERMCALHSHKHFLIEKSQDPQLRNIFFSTFQPNPKQCCVF